MITNISYRQGPVKCTENLLYNCKGLKATPLKTENREIQAFSIQINTTTTHILLHSFSLERSLPPFSLHALGFTDIDKFPNIYFRKSIVAYKYFLSNSYNVKALLSAFIKEVYNYFRFIQTRKRFKIIRLEFTNIFVSYKKERGLKS